MTTTNQQSRNLKTISRSVVRISKLAALQTFGCAMALNCFAGQATKWEQVPAAVQATVLANGGVAGQPVDRENGTDHGKAIYEAGVKGKDGRVADLVITEDGRLLETKHDADDDAAAERGKAARAKQVLAGVKFSHPRDIYHPYLPLACLKQDVLTGTEGGKKTRVERTLLPDKHKVFTISGQSVENRAFINDVLEEVATDYFAQDDFGTVYYLGEDVDEYDENARLTRHKPANDAWLVGGDTPVPGVILLAHPKVGDKFRSEDVSEEVSESDEVVAVGETVAVPAGTFTNCLRVRETLGNGSIEFKYYAPGVGVVREVPADGDEVLVSHTVNEARR